MLDAVAVGQVTEVTVKDTYSRRWINSLLTSIKD